MVLGRNIQVRYDGSKNILDNVSFELVPAKITCFIGPSGGGKTTLLQTIAQINTDYNGTILIEGKDARKFLPRQRAQKVGFVFQNFNLFPHLTSLENCMQPLMVVQNLNWSQAKEKALKVMQQLNIDNVQNAYPCQLSGGQQQRVAISRALCLEPTILLLDEPTSALDPENVRNIQQLLRMLRDQGLTIVLASHDMNFIRGIMDFAYVVEQGKISKLDISHFDERNFL
jgi:ABC-type polar amino acid transport system ATPase subunit